MGDIVQLLGPYHSVQMLGVRLIGFNAQNGKKLLFSVVFLLLVWFLGRLLKWIAGKTGRHENARSVFWSRQLFPSLSRWSALSGSFPFGSTTHRGWL
jgi:hypothetical protein